MSRRRKQVRSGSVPWGWIFVTLIVAFGAGYYWSQGRNDSASEAEAPPLPKQAPSPSVAPPATPAPPEVATEDVLPTRPAIPEPGPIVAVEPGRARIALVIDDLGRSASDLDRVEALGIPWTAAVLPYETHTPAVVDELRKRDIEYLCHLPMQPAKANPGPGALRLDMTPAELAAATRAALGAVPGAAGVNNHMGSVLSVDANAMRTILGELAGRQLFFLDSRTSPDSVGYRLALELGLPATERQVFLDSDPDERAVTGQFRRLLEVARQRGAALAIGHPHEYTFAVLEREVPAAMAAGYEFVPASYLIDRPVLGQAADAVPAALVRQ